MRLVCVAFTLTLPFLPNSIRTPRVRPDPLSYTRYLVDVVTGCETVLLRAEISLRNREGPKRIPAGPEILLERLPDSFVCVG